MKLGPEFEGKWTFKDTYICSMTTKSHWRVRLGESCSTHGMR